MEAIRPTMSLTTDTSPRAASARAFVPLLATWFGGSLAVAFSGVLPHLPPFVIPALIATPVGFAVWRYRTSASFRAAADAIDLRLAVAYHFVRVLFGAMFLYDFQRGLLPDSFARVAGYGDIAVGILAPIAAVIASRGTRGANRIVLAWSLFGLADILGVVANAQRLLLVEHDESLRAAFGRIPYPFLPTFVVPLVIATHFLVIARLLRRAK